MKICSKCSIKKPLDQFHIEPRGRLGRKSKCGSCCAEASKKWKSQNLDREKENRHRWNAANTDRHKESTYTWRKENTHTHNSNISSWQKERKLKDPRFKMLSNIRSLVSNHFSNRNMCKASKLEDLLKMSWPEFYSRIISLLEPEMTKENYGKYWSFDHICPLLIS